MFVHIVHENGGLNWTEQLYNDCFYGITRLRLNLLHFYRGLHKIPQYDKNSNIGVYKCLYSLDNKIAILEYVNANLFYFP